MRPTLKGCRLALVCLAMLVTPVSAARASEHDAIRVVMMNTWDKPEARLVVDPIVVAGDHAIAGWSQGDMGGRALLRKKGQYWDVVLCAGDDLKRSDLLVKAGLPDANAKALSADLAKAEAAIAPARLALFSKFEGLVMVQEDRHHGQHQPDPHHQKH